MNGHESIAVAGPVENAGTETRFMIRYRGWPVRFVDESKLAWVGSDENGTVFPSKMAAIEKADAFLLPMGEETTIERVP